MYRGQGVGGFKRPSFFDSQSLNDDRSSNVPQFNFSRSPLAMQRQMLPISKHRSQLLYAIENFSVIVVVGETGSGKSTQILQYLYENGWCYEQFSVCCTQPRRIAAQTLAQRVSQEVAVDSLGGTVGYSVRFDDRTSENTRIKYMTDGMLLRECSLFDPLLTKYSVIMVDEAHELNYNTETLLGVLKKIRKKRKDLRIIICSATIDAESFLDFFIPKNVRQDFPTPNTSKSENESENNRRKRSRWGPRIGEDKVQDSKVSSDEGIENRGTIISIDGRQHPVDILFSEKAVADYVDASVDTVLQIHFEESKSNSGDILCFLTTGEEIDRAIKMCEDRVDSMGTIQGTNVSHSSQIVFLPLYGTLPFHLQSRVFQPIPDIDSRRRVIFATNIAETSVTVPNIAFVVDCGFVKMPFFDCKNGFERLIISPISQASAMQRAGRSGRVKNGKCYRLYTEAAMSKYMQVQTEPEILRSNLSSFILMLKTLGIHNVLTFDLLNTPSIPALKEGLETLYALGAIDEQTNMTDIGYKMSEFPLEPRLSRILLESLSHGCSKEILCIVSALQVRSLFHQPRTPKQQIDYDAAMDDIRDCSSDHMTYYNLMQLHDRTPLNDSEAKDRFVNFMALKRSFEVKKQLTNCLRRYGRIEGMDMGQSEEDVSNMCRKVLTTGLFLNTAKLGNDGRYYSLRGKHMIGISTSSVLFKYGLSSEYIIFSETLDGSRGGIEVKSVSSIEARWLREKAQHYFR